MSKMWMRGRLQEIDVPEMWLHPTTRQHFLSLELVDPPMDFISGQCSDCIHLLLHREY